MNVLLYFNGLIGGSKLPTQKIATQSQFEQWCKQVRFGTRKYRQLLRIRSLSIVKSLYSCIYAACRQADSDIWHKGIFVFHCHIASYSRMGCPIIFILQQHAFTFIMCISDTCIYVQQPVMESCLPLHPRKLRSNVMKPRLFAHLRQL